MAHVEDVSNFAECVGRVLMETEPGDVMTYGEVAEEAGFPGAARAVGNFLKESHGVPWWRVVAASGRLHPHGHEEQARLLAGEGIKCRNGFLAK